MQILASMYDYARGQCVSLETLKAIVANSAKFGFSHFVINFEDISLFLKPEVHDGSLSIEKLKLLDSFASELGVTIIPVIPCLSHAMQTFMHKAYSDLAEFPGAGVYDIQNSAVMELLNELLHKAADIFAGEYVHIGCDEAWDLGLGNAPSSSWPMQQYGEHVNKMADIVLSLGKKPLFWGDMTSRYFPELAIILNKKLIPVEWCYRCEKQFPLISWWQDNGFEQVVIAPSIGYNTGIFPEKDYASTNIYSYVSAGIEVGVAGVILTAWEHTGITRYADREQMNYLGASIANRCTQQSVNEILREYWQVKSAARAEQIMEFYCYCDSFGKLLPQWFSDHCDDFIVRRDYWGKYYYNSFEHLAMLEQLENSIAQLAKIISVDWPEEQYNPYKTTALRARHILGLLRLSPRDKSSMALRIDLLKKYTRLEWLDEREVLPNSPLNIIMEKYNRQKKIISNITFNETKLQWPISETPQILAAQECFTGEPTIDSLAVLGHPECSENDKTNIWFAWDAEGLKIKINCHQSGIVRAAEIRSDLILTRDDMISFQIDPAHGHYESFWIEFNPAGIIAAEIHDIEGKKVFDPRLPINAEVFAEIGTGSWQLNIIIPFISMKIDVPKAGDIWGVSVHRRNRHTHEESFWGGDPMLSRSSPEALGHLAFCGCV